MVRTDEIYRYPMAKWDLVRQIVRYPGLQMLSLTNSPSPGASEREREREREHISSVCAIVFLPKG